MGPAQHAYAQAMPCPVQAVHCRQCLALLWLLSVSCLEARSVGWGQEAHWAKHAAVADV